MSPRRWLPTMVRAQQAREDSAARRLAQARMDAAQAVEAAAVETARIAGITAPATASLGTFLNRAATRDAAAATHSAAVHRVQFAQQRVDVGLSELGSAAQARRTVERLSERIAAETYAAELSRQQRELDDVTITRFGRTSGGQA
jgi:flagellar biosynthesis chaperone FliJ